MTEATEDIGSYIARPLQFTLSHGRMLHPWIIHRVEALVDQLRSANLSPAARVALLFRCVDMRGNELEPVEVPIWPPDQDQPSDPVVENAADEICQRMEAQVRQLVSGSVLVRKDAEQLVYVNGLNLQIRE